MTVQWRLQRWGMPSQKGGEQRCHQMNWFGLASGYPGRLNKDGGFRIKVESAKKQALEQEEIMVYSALRDFMD